MKKIVYFGPGWCIPGHKNGPAIKDTSEYICIETPKNNLWSSIGQSFYDRLPEDIKKKVRLLRVSGKKTGLDYGFADETHLYNILGDRDIIDSLQILYEAIRITRTGGYLFVGEILSPYPISSLIKIAGTRGLSPNILINGSETDITEEDKETIYTLIGEYYRATDNSPHNNPINKNSYLVRFKKYCKIN